MFGYQERVRPARRCDQGDLPGAARRGAGDRAAELEAAPGLWALRVLVLFDRLDLTRRTGPTVVLDQVTSVAVHRDRHDRVWKPFAVPVEIEDGVHECVAHRVPVQRVIAIGDVEPVT